MRPSPLLALAALAVASVLLTACDGSAPPRADDVADTAEDAGAHADVDAGAIGHTDHDASKPPSPPPDAALDAAPAPDTGADTGTDAPVPPLDSDGDGTPDATDCAPHDPTAWQSLKYAYRDADGDGFSVVASGTVCSGASLPSGYSTASANGDDCNDADPSVHAVATFYADVDGDGVGAGAGQSMCASVPPAGFASTSTDCAPSDAAKWQALDYAYRDGDGDGYTVALSGQICAGGALPPGYATAANGDDCDDANPKVFAPVTVYADGDGDGVGAGKGVAMCTDGTAPAGSSLSPGDCAPSDGTKWQTLAYSFVDKDGDGATAPSSGSICAGADLPPPYYATALGNDCDDANALVTHWDVVWPDKDQDGAGAGAYVFKCDGATLPAGFSRYGDDENDLDAKVGPLPPEDILDLVLP